MNGSEGVGHPFLRLEDLLLTPPLPALVALADSAWHATSEPARSAAAQLWLFHLARVRGVPFCVILFSSMVMQLNVSTAAHPERLCSEGSVAGRVRRSRFATRDRTHIIAIIETLFGGPDTSCLGH